MRVLAAAFTVDSVDTYVDICFYSQTAGRDAKSSM